MSDMIPLDEAIEAAGLCLFGDDWIGPQPEPDKEFLKKQIAPYAEGAIGPLDKSTAERLDRIIGRGERSVLQRCFTRCDEVHQFSVSRAQIEQGALVGRHRGPFEDPNEHHFVKSLRP